MRVFVEIIQQFASRIVKVNPVTIKIAFEIYQVCFCLFGSFLLSLCYAGINKVFG